MKTVTYFLVSLITLVALSSCVTSTKTKVDKPSVEAKGKAQTQQPEKKTQPKKTQSEKRAQKKDQSVGPKKTQSEKRAQKKNQIKKILKAKPQKDNITVKVKGMVCSFCAQGIEKQFKKFSELESIKVNLDTMEVDLKFKPGKSLSEETIKKVIVDAGFSFVGIKN